MVLVGEDGGVCGGRHGEHHGRQAQQQRIFYERAQHEKRRQRHNDQLDERQQVQLGSSEHIAQRALRQRAAEDQHRQRRGDLAGRFDDVRDDARR